MTGLLLGKKSGKFVSATHQDCVEVLELMFSLNKVYKVIMVHSIIHVQNQRLIEIVSSHQSIPVVPIPPGGISGAFPPLVQLGAFDDLVIFTP